MIKKSIWCSVVTITILTGVSLSQALIDNRGIAYYIVYLTSFLLVWFLVLDYYDKSVDDINN